MRYVIVLLLLFAISLSANSDRALKMMKVEQRVALVIGNSSYNSSRLANLKNPLNDARAMRDKLQSLGFKVFYGENLSVRSMDKKLRIFGSKLAKGGVGLFYFAGHGIESSGENYLMGKDSKVVDKADVPYESLALNKVIDRMKDSGNRLNIILLDACRSDPFSRGGGGLAKVYNARGMFIAYATSPGDVASDGKGKHGVFTQEILNNIDAKGIPLERVFKRIKRDVYEETNQKQRPWTHDDIIGEFFFRLPSNTTHGSTTSFKNIAPTHFNLTVNTTPSDAKVYITNIKPKYYDGMRLKKGIYNIKVVKSGYITKKGTLTLNEESSINVVLEKKVTQKTKYTSRKNVVVLDGLMWQNEPYTEAEKKVFEYNNYKGGNYEKVQDWNGAINYCRDLTLAGYDDWRLPNKEELVSITDKSGMPAIKKEFKNTSSVYYWSSTASGEDFAWYVHFGRGIVMDTYKGGHNFYVRCVRDGQ